MNNLGQRTAVATAGEVFAQSPADWTYDALGQITGANTDQYTYDQIGNRRTSGKQNGAQTAYTTNALNQYTSVHTTEPAYDADGNQLTGLTATAALPDRNTLTFTWNADNRPVEIKQNGEPKELRTYDHMGRRIRKGDTLTLYDGYNAIAEYNLNTRTLKTTYAWGNDLSGTPQGAGGVGGLLSVTEHDRQTPLVSYPCYDGNGNISEYLTEENGGTLAAHYEYDAFGNVTKKTEEKEYSYQFSTKPYDSLTGLNYYNYRDYDPVNGRWINRDPIEERGGVNLYCVVGNMCINYIDRLGMGMANVKSNSTNDGDDISVSIEIEGYFEYNKKYTDVYKRPSPTGFVFYYVDRYVLEKVPFKGTYNFKCKKNGGISFSVGKQNSSDAPDGEDIGFSVPLPANSSIGIEASTSYRYNFDGTDVSIDPLEGNEKGNTATLDFEVKLIESNIISSVGSIFGFSGSNITNNKDEKILDTINAKYSYECRCR